MAHGIHYPLMVLGKMPCNRGVQGKKNRAMKKRYGGSTGWAQEQARQRDSKADWYAADSYASTWQPRTWDRNAASAVADKKPESASGTGYAMKASAVADDATETLPPPRGLDAGYPRARTSFTGRAHGRGAGKRGGRRQPPPGPHAINYGLQGAAADTDEEVPWAS